MKKAICLLLSFIMIMSLATSISASVTPNRILGASNDQYDSNWSIVVNKYNYDATYDEAVLDCVLPQGYSKHGRCGKNVYWGYYDDTKTLIIGGEGKHESRDSFKLKFEYDELPFEKAIVQEGVTELDSWAFANCESMKEVSLPDSLTKIDSSAFRCCKSLKSVRIPKNVSFWGMGNFYYCESLEEITVDPENKTFDSRDNCNAIIATQGDFLRDACKNTTIPESVTNIGSMAYFGVIGIKEITIPDNVKNIYGQAFEECVDLETVRLHSDVNLHPSGIFAKCEKLKNVYLSDSLTLIGMQEFSGCISLESIVIPSSVKRIEQSAFDNCTALKTVVIEDGVQGIGPGAFSGCTALEEIVFPKSVQEIQIAAFKNCTALKSVTVYNSQCVIGDIDITFPEHTVIYAEEGSTAQAYAQKYGRTFKPLSEAPQPSAPTDPTTPTEPTTPPEPTGVLGDVDLDGKMSVLDATEIQMVLAQIKSWKHEACVAQADVDKDTKVSVLDATEIQMILAQLKDFNP